MTRLVGLLAVVLLLAAAARAQSLTPPFVRAWTALTGEDTAVVGIRDALVYYRSEGQVGAVGLDNGQRQWTASVPGVRDALLYGATIVLARRRGTKGQLTVRDRRTGRSRWESPLPSPPVALAADARHLFVLDSRAALAAIDPASGRLLWRQRLAPQTVTLGSYDVHLAATADGVYVALDGQAELGIDPRDGRIRWRHAGNVDLDSPPRVAGRRLLLDQSRLRFVDAGTGAVVWTAKSGYTTQIVGDVVVTAQGEGAVGRRLRDGRRLWHDRAGYRQYGFRGREDPMILPLGQMFWLRGQRTTYAIDVADGRLLWRRQDAYTGTPRYVDASHLVTVENERLLGYRAGTLPPVPADPEARRSLAAHLTAGFESGDDAERAQLRALVPEAIEPLLTRFVAWAQSDGANPLARSCLFAASDLLAAVCRKTDTPALVAAWQRLGPGNGWRDLLERILEATGEPSGYIPAFVAALRQLPRDQRNESAMLSAVAHAPHPEAAAFLLEALRDPTATRAWRHAAFVHLAGIGADESVAAVRAAGAVPRPRRPWYERIDQKRVRSAERTDARGRVWRLFQSGVLGNFSDLFIARRNGEGWGRPLFTGVAIGSTFTAREPTSYRGIPIRTLLRSAWVRLFPDDPALRADRDGDTLTDLVERRLGTDPQRADTDGDGLGDATDPCPNAAPRILGDREQIIAAAIAARFFETEWDTPAVLQVRGVAPIELRGYPGTLLWSSRRTDSLSKQYGAGMNSLTFHAPDGVDKKEWVVFGDGGRTARTVLSRYSGGRNGDGTEVVLRKIGDEWFVMDWIPRYVS